MRLKRILCIYVHCTQCHVHALPLRLVLNLSKSLHPVCVITFGCLAIYYWDMFKYQTRRIHSNNTLYSYTSSIGMAQPCMRK